MQSGGRRSTARRGCPARAAQTDHLHLIIEADDRTRLSGGLRGLAIRVARAVNRALGRRGAVWGDRYHARPLTTPREVRNALVYVLQNVAKHARGLHGLDPCSSARWFDGWHDAAAAGTIERAPAAKARTWLATVGWRRHGLINPYTEAPKTQARRLREIPRATRRA